MVVVFVLIVIVTQVAFVVVARDTAQTAVAAAARRAGRPGADIGAVESRLEAEIARVVPGADGIDATVEMSRTGVTARAAIRWRPPGPDLMPITIHAASTAAVVVPP